MPVRKSAKSYPKLGGERTDKALTDFKDHEAVIAQNCRFDKAGRVRTRKGGEKYNDTQMGSASNILGLHHFKYGSSGSKFLEAWDEYIYSDDGTTRTQIASGQDTSAYYSFVNFDDFCWINNGVDTMLKYDGTTVTNACLSAPSVGTFAAAAGAAGNVDGTVGYVVTFRVSSTGQESNPFTLASAVFVTVASKQVGLTNIPVSSDSQVNQRRIYRTTDGGSIYDAQLVATINDNTTTSYTDDVADADLGSLVPLDHDTAPVLQKVIVHRNRGFGFAPNSSTLYFTLVNNLWYWPQGQVDLSTTQKIYTLFVNPDDGDNITNIVSYGDTVIIFKNNARYVLSGFDETEFQIDKIEDDFRVGCVSHRAAKVCGGWCYFLDSSGPYKTSIYDTKYISAAEGFFDPDNSNVSEKVNKQYLSSAVAEVNARKPYHFVQFSAPTGTSTVNNFHILIDYKEDDYLSHDTGYVAQSMAILETNNQDYLMRGDDYGFVWTMDSIEGDGGLIYSTSTGSNTSTTLNDTALSMTVDAYAGAPIEIISGTGEGERFTIESNTATEFTIDGTWGTTPDDTSVYAVGGIDFDYQHKWDDYSKRALTKRLNSIRPYYDTTGNYSASIYFMWDFQQALSESSEVSFSGIDLTLWDVSLWDVGLWDSVSIIQEKIRPPSGHVHRWGSVRWNHKIPGQPIVLNSFDKVFQLRVPR